jgi:hypothetical protein
VSLVNIAAVKAGVQATGFTADDVLLGQLADAAEAAIQGYLRYNLEQEHQSELPADIQQAVIMLVYHFYEAPLEGQDADADAWPSPVKLLLASHRRFV